MVSLRPADHPSSRPEELSGGGGFSAVDLHAVECRHDVEQPGVTEALDVHHDRATHLGVDDDPANPLVCAYDSSGNERRV